MGNRFSVITNLVQQISQKQVNRHWRKYDRNCIEDSVTPLTSAAGYKLDPGSVFFCAFHPVEDILACALSDGKISVFQGPSRKIVPFAEWVVASSTFPEIIPHAMTAMTTLEWNGDGSSLAAGFENGAMFFWYPLIEKSFFVESTAGTSVWGLCWNTFTSELMATFSHQTVVLWVTLFPEPYIIHRISFHRNLVRDVVWISSDRFATCSDDGTIHLCQVYFESPLKVFKHEAEVLSLSWNSSLELLASRARDGSVTVWSLDHEEPKHRLTSEPSYKSQCIDWYPHRPASKEKKCLIACGLQDGRMIIWDLMTDRREELFGHSCMVYDVSFSPDGRFLASIDLQGDFIIRSSQNWQEIEFQCKLSFRATKRCLRWQSKQGYKVAVANPGPEVHVIEYVDVRGEE